MAYSDYGGYAYRNGQHVIERSDYTIQPDGTGFGTPGAYPGFAAIAAGANAEQAKSIAAMPQYHAVLGDGPIFIGLYKQSGVHIHRGAQEVPLIEAAKNVSDDRIKEYGGKRYLDAPYSFTNDQQPTVFEVDGHKIEVRWVEDDNYYVYVRLTQPDGAVWTGFSGYGVGAGLEDCGYGFSTEDCEGRLADIFS